MKLVEFELYTGERITGETWEDILRTLKLTNFSNPKDLEELMLRLRYRIEVFTGETIGVGTYQDFIHELQRVGFLKIISAKLNGTEERNQGGN